MYAVSTSMASTKLVCKKRKISGYNIYHREILKSSDPSVCLGDLNKMIGEQWQALAQQEREEFNQIASVEPTRVATLKDFLNHLAKLSNAIKDTFGAEMFFTLVKGNEHYCGGTTKEISFLEDQAPYIPYSFIGYLHHPVATSGAQILADTDINVKRKQVEEVFNKLCGEANRDGSKKLPYSKISSLGITLTGLPDGVSLKHSSSYGRKQLQSILDCKERLIINFCSPVHGDRQSSRVNTTVGGAVGNRTGDGRPRMNTTVSGAVGNRTEDGQPRVNTTVGGAVGNRTGDDQPRETVQSESDEIVVLLSPTRQPVGLGQVIQSQDIHGHTISPAHVKVQIDYIIPGICPPVPMPFDDGELCSGQFAAWPRSLTTSATF
ncbi:uncharacterized protein [Dysidea avara]|uniref:uncharacterized protein isoform X4 n=1 Tax=Dysidea avara TaxID=196820 RepID=UPI00331C0108